MSLYEGPGELLNYLPALSTSTETIPIFVPEITSITSQVSQRGETKVITLEGKGLRGLSEMTFSGAGITKTKILSGATDESVQVELKVSSSAPFGYQNFQIFTFGGIAKSEDFNIRFGVFAVPTITRITPSRGERGDSFHATIQGTGLTGANRVYFSGSGVTGTILSGGTDSSITVRISISRYATLGYQTFTVSNPGYSDNSGSTVRLFVAAPPGGSSALFNANRGIGGDSI